MFFAWTQEKKKDKMLSFFEY